MLSVITRAALAAALLVAVAVGGTAAHAQDAPAPASAVTPKQQARADKQALKQASRDARNERRTDAEREELLQVFVAEPYLELRTGPGRGYPVTQVVIRDESVDKARKAIGQERILVNCAGVGGSVKTVSRDKQTGPSRNTRSTISSASFRST